MQNFRKHISFVLILNLFLFASGQAYIISDGFCYNSETKIDESTNCCCEVVEIEESICCLSVSSNDVVKFESTTSQSCEECSTGCTLNENFDYSSPTLFASISFSLKKLDGIESENIYYNNENLNTSDSNNKPTYIKNDEIPKLFGKNLLIQTHTLKIPLILV